MSGRTYLTFLKLLKSAGYRIEIIYLRLNSPAVALRRIAARVRQGGHDVPRADVIRRITRSRELFPSYRALADAWAVYDNTGISPVLVEKGP
jgi:predicted ABC-type ATPase